jgi:hypothetical protein
MSYDFTISALVFTIIMVLFNIVKDFIILPKFKVSEEQLKKINKRWYISFGIGLFLLYLIYA